MTAPIRVLFVCTGNSARSIMAEALLRHVGGDSFAALSAGTIPTRVHPLAEGVLDAAGIARDGLRSKSLADVAGEPFDYVITLCDDARAACPIFPGADQSLHWGYSDPASVEGTEAERVAAFQRVFTLLAERIRQFVLLAARTRSAGVA
ncbi:MAG: arsenate reductase ArsC [Candidatus Limnocylindrales bacterium]